MAETMLPRRAVSTRPSICRPKMNRIDATMYERLMTVVMGLP